MLKNYFKIAWRNLGRNLSFSVINILGLSIGMASALLILLWIQNEVSYDRFHEKDNRLYRINNRDKFDGELHAWESTPKVLAGTLKREYPEVEDAARISDVSFLVIQGEKRLNMSGYFTDPGFFNLFSFPLVAGKPDALNAPNHIVLTQKSAQKLFGDQNAIGKTVTLDSTARFTVAGVLKDLPNNTRFDFEYLLPWSYMKKLGWDDEYWGNNTVSTFVLLKPGISQASFDVKIKNTTIRHNPTSAGAPVTTQIFTQLYRDTWLYSKSEKGQYVGGRVERVRLFSVIAAFILLIACINFMNLSTARSEKRAKEVGVRKVVGAPKSTLIIQFITESILLSLFAGILAVIIVSLCLPAFNDLVGKRLFIPFANPLYWLFGLGFVAFTGILAGSYPALYLSSFRPVKVLKGTYKAAKALVTPRKFLVVLQFTFAVTLVVCTLIVVRQINYAQSRDTGYNKDHLIYVGLQGDILKHFEAIKNELLSNGDALGVAKSMSPMTQRYSDGWGYSWKGSTAAEKKVDFVRMAADNNFIKTMNLKLVQGRDIDIKNYPTDSTAVLLNETAVNIMHLKNPLGQTIMEDKTPWHVVGVVKDFIYESPYQKVQQMMIFGPKSWFTVMHIRLNPNRPVQQSLDNIGKIFQRYNPKYPFEYKFVDEQYARKFEDEKRIGTLAGLFAGLTIFLSCLGIFGLAAYMAENRIKEVGVRKVLGASVGHITALLSVDFLKLIAIAIIIASPIAWWAMYTWLQTYDYRISINIWVFVVAGLGAVGIALFTVGFQAFRAAIAKPIKSLRSE
ncbi:ABC transporter permease [Mucilaginibacter sp.]